MKRINRASMYYEFFKIIFAELSDFVYFRKGKVDIFVQSTDKNLCVPVGGAIIASFNTQIFSALTEICSGIFVIIIISFTYYMY